MCQNLNKSERFFIFLETIFLISHDLLLEVLTLSWLRYIRFVKMLRFAPLFLILKAKDVFSG